MFKEKDMSNVIGQTYGIYTILYECDHKSTDGHRLFHVKCNQCGFETDMQFRYINRAKECNHIKAFGTYINPKIRWKNQRIREIFAGMIQRCYNSTNKNYCLYGAKGKGNPFQSGSAGRKYEVYAWQPERRTGRRMQQY